MMTMMMMIVFIKYISWEKQRSYRSSEVLSWCISVSAIHNTWRKLLLTKQCLARCLV